MKTLAILAAVAAVAIPAAASARGPFDVTETARTSARGLDLGNSRDAAQMVARLDRAALSVCGASRFSARDVVDATRKSDCYADSMNRAVAGLNAPAVDAIYRQHAPVRLAAR